MKIKQKKIYEFIWALNLQMKRVIFKLRICNSLERPMTKFRDCDAKLGYGARFFTLSPK